MQVASMLSAGYLEPVSRISPVKSVNQVQDDGSDSSKKILRSRGVSQVKNNFSVNNNNEDASLERQERDILAQEQNLKAKIGSGAEVHTVYHYTIGSDGKKYITGASVTMKGDEEDLSRVGGMSTSDIQVKADEDLNKVQAAGDDRSSSQKSKDANSKGGDGANNNLAGEELSEEAKQVINELENTEREVIAHEAAHQAAAGAFGGGVSYSYTKGPDGKSYITGGEVPIQMRTGSTPEETIRNMEQVQRAATAPADPSGQDRKVAAKAAAIAAQARQELIAENDRKTEVAKGTPLFENVNNENKNWNGEDDKHAPVKNGVASIMASIREFQVQSLLPAA